MVDETLRDIVNESVPSKPNKVSRARTRITEPSRLRRSSLALLWVAVLAAVSVRGELVRSTGITRDSSGVTVSFDAIRGSTYRLERKLDLTQGSWQGIPGVNDFTATTNGPAQIVDSSAVNLSQAFYRVNLILCDAGIASNTTDPLQYAAAMELCQTTTEQGTAPGVISARLTLANGAGTPAAVSRSIRTSFGNNAPRGGGSFVVLSTGAAAAPGQVNPAYSAFQPGVNTGTSSTAPADWLAANGGQFPNAPGCPPPPAGTTVWNPVMLTLRVRVPSYAHSFRVSAKFFSSEFPEYVCSAYNDMFVVLLDSTYNGTPANPADKNLAIYTAPNSLRYPVGVNLATGNTGLFTDCRNGGTGCAAGSVAGSTSACTGTSGLTGTGFDLADPGQCNASSLVGGGTAWLSIRGNVVPGEVITVRFALWDTGDATYDSLVLLDNFAWSSEAVTPGAVLEEN